MCLVFKSFEIKENTRKKVVKTKSIDQNIKRRKVSCVLTKPIFICCTMSMVAIATHFLSIFTGCKFAFVIYYTTNKVWWDLNQQLFAEQEYSLFRWPCSRCDRFKTQMLSGFPRGIKSIEFQNWFSRPWKSIEFGQNVH